MLLLSVLALICIQTFQIVQLYDRKENQFTTKVNDCLNRISYRHEKGEDLKRYLQIVNRDFSGEYREILKDEFKDLISARETISIRDTTVYLKGKKEQFLILQGDVFDTISGISAQQKVLIRDVREIKDLMGTKGDTSRMAIELNQKVTQQIFTKAKFINEMMIEAFRDNIHVSPESRLDIYFLDSIIRSELRTEELPMKYKFSVVDENNQALEYKLGNGNYDNEIISKPEFSQVKLFPNNLLNEDLFLIIDFPEKNEFIFQEMKNTFLLTGILVVFIVIALIFMFKTIMQQRKLSELKSDFISNMTHEFKTPISTISLACQAAMDKDMIGNSSSAEKMEPFIAMISKENKRLELLVEGILQSAVIDKGKISGNYISLNIAEVLRGLLENAKFRIESLHGAMHYNEVGTDFVVKADKIHLTNLMANILDNSIKYSKDCPVINVELEQKQDGIKLRVKDKGIGIKKEDLPKIFDRLYRVPTGNVHNVKGFGLGLSYVKSICDNYGWKIKAESEFGEGTTIEIIFKKQNNER